MTKQNPTRLLVVVALLTAMVMAVGCSGGDANPEIDKVAEKANGEMADLGKAAKDAGGDFDKLPQAAKDKFLARTGGSEAQAKEMVKRIAGMAGGPPGPGGPPKSP